LRILFVARGYPPDEISGRGLAFAGLYEEARRHADVRLVAGWRRTRGSVPAEALGVALTGSGPADHFRLARAMRQVIRRFTPDVVVASSLDLPIAARPSVAVVRDLVDTGWELARGLSNLATRIGLRRYDRIVVPTHAAREEVREAGAGRWAVERIAEGWSEWPAFEERKPGDVLQIVTGARIHPGKGIHLAIDAVSRLTVEEKRRVRLHVVGPVADRRYLDQLRIGARGQPVSFFPDEPAGPQYQRADLAIYPTSVAEGFADRVVEAMAWGLPVVWADHPGVRETACGLGFPVIPDDVLALREVIRRALAGELPLAAVGRAGREAARARYDWSAIWPRWEELFRGLLPAKA
jgi:glycosyltransferase involved in cell wall biosynthesis